MRTVLFLIAIICGVPVLHAQMGPFCEELSSSDDEDIAGYTDVIDVCHAQLDTYSGSFVVVERGFFPIPNKESLKNP